MNSKKISDKTEMISKWISWGFFLLLFPLQSWPTLNTKKCCLTEVAINFVYVVEITLLGCPKMQKK